MRLSKIIKKTKTMSIYKKLLEAKKEIGKISKDSTNPFFKSKYFDVNSLLEHVEPILQKNELLLLQPIEAEWVKTQIFDVETGEKISSEICLGGIKDPQKLGSAITYYRRYTLQSLLGLQAEDDDANKASKKPATLDINRLNARLNACTDTDKLGEVYKSFTREEQIATKELATVLKQRLTLKTA